MRGGIVVAGEDDCEVCDAEKVDGKIVEEADTCEVEYLVDNVDRREGSGASKTSEVGLLQETVPIESFPQHAHLWLVKLYTTSGPAWRAIIEIEHQHNIQCNGEKLATCSIVWNSQG